jgi:hypothetical protein
VFDQAGKINTAAKNNLFIRLILWMRHPFIAENQQSELFIHNRCNQPVFRQVNARFYAIGLKFDRR